jgi:ABC-type nitrate/sulfonate/bicarbonate transport system substrate-binding protein
MDGIVVRSAFVHEHPEAVQAFVDGWIKGVDYWMTNPQEGNEAAAQISGDDPADISLEGIDLKTLADNQALFQQGDTTASLFYTAQLYVDYFISTGTLSTPPDVQNLINGTFVNK